DTFVIISGDSLTDFDLTAVIDFHRAHDALVTIALKSVDNPLEFGVVIVDVLPVPAEYYLEPPEGRYSDYRMKPGYHERMSPAMRQRVKAWRDTHGLDTPGGACTPPPSR
ncbi:MAG: hypothetical protein GYA24_01505, partial [Candidatus Lokiarchaeota archaeon]|nr:hypothetical protein [Candidatus Lokiarchaeota archaeon]